MYWIYNLVTLVYRLFAVKQKPITTKTEVTLQCKQFIFIKMGDSYFKEVQFIKR